MWRAYGAFSYLFYFCHLPLTVTVSNWNETTACTPVSILIYSGIARFRCESTAFLHMPMSIERLVLFLICIALCYVMLLTVSVFERVFTVFLCILVNKAFSYFDK